MELSYLELNLPVTLQEALDAFKQGLKQLETNPEYCRFDCDIMLLSSEINCAEVENLISKAQADYLRTEYLGWDNSPIN